MVKVYNDITYYVDSVFNMQIMTAKELIKLLDRAVKLLEEDNKKKDRESREFRENLENNRKINFIIL